MVIMEVPSIHCECLRDLLEGDDSGCLVLDCRSFFSFNSSHIPGSSNVRFSTIVRRRARGGLGLEHVCRVLLAWQLLDLTRPVVTKKFIQFLIWCASGDDVCFFSTFIDIHIQDISYSKRHVMWQHVLQMTDPYTAMVVRKKAILSITITSFSFIVFYSFQCIYTGCTLHRETTVKGELIGAGSGCIAALLTHSQGNLTGWTMGEAVFVHSECHKLGSTQAKLGERST